MQRFTDEEIEGKSLAHQELLGVDRRAEREIIENMVFYSDGSNRPAYDPSELGAYRDPPSDPIQLAKNLRYFWEYRLERRVSEFTRKRHIAKVHGPSAADLPGLQELATEIRSIRAKLGHLNRQIRGYEPGDLEEARKVRHVFDAAYAAEYDAGVAFHEALRSGKCSAGKLEQLKTKLEAAKVRTRVTLHAWNTFEPRQARDVIIAEVEDARRQAAQAELDRQLSALEI